MGGNGGVIIIRGHAVQALSDPMVHGQLPHDMCATIDPILAKDPMTWLHSEKVAIGHAFSWAVCNLQ